MRRFPRGPLTPLVLAAGLLAGCFGPADEPHGGTPHAARSTAQAPATAAAPAAMADTTVTIDNFTYSPAQLTVPAGTKVTWTNHDDVPHTVTSPTKPRLIDSPTLDTDQSFSFTFREPGTYDYFCGVHPKMTGKVIVK
jgi:amicyanin